MNPARTVRKISKSRPTIEGAGVRLRRAFGHDEVPLFDPFLMLDDFRGDRAEHYSKGFPWHPHRGIETITYMLAGEVEHGDSLGNKGTLGPGDLQWMTAGSGIIHQEMPKGDRQGRMGGFQLWANLPAAHKMMSPRYQDVKAEAIPVIRHPGGAVIRVVCGSVDGVSGPVRDIVIEPLYLDVSLPAGAELPIDIEPGHKAFVYVFEGRGRFDDRQGRDVDSESLVLFTDAEERVAASAGEVPLRFLLVAGRPIGEPVAWHGPIVMNTSEELRVAFDEYAQGTFIKHP